MAGRQLALANGRSGPPGSLTTCHIGMTLDLIADCTTQLNDAAPLSLTTGAVLRRDDEAEGWHGQRLSSEAEKSTVRAPAPRSTVDCGSFLAFADRATPRMIPAAARGGSERQDRGDTLRLAQELLHV